MHLERMAEGSHLALYDSGSDVKLQQQFQCRVFNDTLQLASL